MVETQLTVALPDLDLLDSLRSSQSGGRGGNVATD
jgi:hypothetical protein